ncbi:MAG: acetyl-CoA hydrolase/transferase family protein [Chloroflexi bacterium]|nr:acetyl-CoA hydrolase/transferase family protein [Chloroflexota bacterium]
MRRRHPPAHLSAEEALAHVRSGDRVFLHGAAATPHALLRALTSRADQLVDVEIVHMHANGPAPHVAPTMAGHLRHRALFIADNTRQAVNEGRADFVPVFLSDIPHLFTSDALPLDVALLHVSPADHHGYCSLGTSVDAAKAAAESAKLVIAQVNPRMPRTLGDSFLHLSQVDFLVRADEPLPASNPEPIGEVERQIGIHVASLIEDGVTLQLGIGGIPNAVLAALGDKRDLGVHTEMFSDGLLDLVLSGVVNGRAKTLHPGKIVATFLMGSQRLYDWVDDNPMVEMHPVDYTNDTSVIRRNAGMTAINSAIQVDLTGQVCADSIGTRFFSGVGGQMDFMRGAALSPGGKAIIALPSTAKRGSVSRIVPTLLEGAGVTTTRAHVQYIVTEYGLAFLHGKSIRERARALIEIAHPQFRSELTGWARQHEYL